MPATPVFPLTAGAQSYDWGQVGSSSRVGRYVVGGGIPGIKIDESKPYAELWLGTHSSLPSRLLETGEALDEHLAAHPELIGSSVLRRFEDTHRGQLPFLFKILAIRKTLSIQAHPDKKLAERLHDKWPDLYKDPNHKPEMAIALTPFTALCGFRPLPQISTYLSNVPELAALVPPAVLSAFQRVASLPASDLSARALLRDVFSAVMTTPPELVREQVRILVERYRSGGHVAQEADVHALVVKLDTQFQNDIGVFCVFLLNVIQLHPGEAIFLGPGEPHAYIAGDIVETMATSDNVLRAGLTPKPRDVSNLVAALTYNAADPVAHSVIPTSFPRGSAFTSLYDPPIPEFAVLRTSLSSGERETHEALQGPSLLIVIQGAGWIAWEGSESLVVNEGSVLFVSTGTQVSFEAEKELVVYRAFVEG